MRYRVTRGEVIDPENVAGGEKIGPRRGVEGFDTFFRHMSTYYDTNTECAVCALCVSAVFRRVGWGESLTSSYAKSEWCASGPDAQQLPWDPRRGRRYPSRR